MSSVRGLSYYTESNRTAHPNRGHQLISILRQGKSDVQVVYIILHLSAYQIQPQRSERLMLIIRANTFTFQTTLGQCGYNFMRGRNKCVNMFTPFHIRTLDLSFLTPYPTGSTTLGHPRVSCPLPHKTNLQPSEFGITNRTEGLFWAAQ